MVADVRPQVQPTWLLLGFRRSREMSLKPTRYTGKMTVRGHCLVVMIEEHPHLKTKTYVKNPPHHLREHQCLNPARSVGPKWYSVHYETRVATVDEAIHAFHQRASEVL